MNTADKKYYTHENKLMKKIRETDRLCNYPSCQKSAIKSHILQENGILNWIANDKKLYMEHTSWGAFRAPGFYPSSIRKSNGMTFKGFCDYHDTEVFKEIEDGNLDFRLYRHKLLFSYRGLLKDLFEAVISVDFANKAIHDPQLPQNWKRDYEKRRNRDQLKVNELKHFKWFIEQELFNTKKEASFQFYLYELPKIEIVTTTVFGDIAVLGITGFEDLDYKALRAITSDNENYKPLVEPAFVNLIPQESNLLCILGHLKCATKFEFVPVAELPNLSNLQLAALLSTILPRIEFWGMSETLFQQWNADGRIKYVLDGRASWLDNSQRVFRTDAELQDLKHKRTLLPFNILD